MREKGIVQISETKVEKLLKSYLKGKYTISEFTEEINKELLDSNISAEYMAELIELRKQNTRLNKKLSKENLFIEIERLKKENNLLRAKNRYYSNLIGVNQIGIYSKEGKLIKICDNLVECAKFVKIDKASISRSMKRKRGEDIIFSKELNEEVYFKWT